MTTTAMLWAIWGTISAITLIVIALLVDLYRKRATARRLNRTLNAPDSVPEQDNS